MFNQKNNNEGTCTHTHRCNFLYVIYTQLNYSLLMACFVYTEEIEQMEWNGIGNVMNHFIILFG